MIKLLLTFSLIIITNASTINLDYSSVKVENFTISYLLDNTSSLTVNQIKNLKFKSNMNTHGFHRNTGTSWYKINLQNTTDLTKKIYLHNNLAYFYEQTIIFEFYNNVMRNKDIYNMLESKSSNKLIGSTLVHKVIIPANNTVTIYMKNTPMVNNLFDLNIYDEHSSSQALLNKDFYSLIIISIIITLALYNVMLYFFNQRKEFLFYALYMITPAIGLNYKYGTIFSQYQFYGEGAYLLNITAILMPLFLILFVQKALHTKKLNKKINISLNILLFLFTIDVALAFIVDLTFAMEVFNYLFLLTTIVIIYLIVYLFKTSHPLAKLFSIAYIFYFSGVILTLLAMEGVVTLNAFTFRSAGIGLIFEGLIFSYLMHYNVKRLEKEIRDQREIIIVKNKKAQLGEMISAITHQWKQPLARISSITGVMEFQLENKKILSPEELNKSISQINTNTHFLNDTIDDFKNFFNTEQEKNNCNLNELIEKSIVLSSDDTLTKEITITSDLKFSENIKIYQNELLHILLNIIQNAKEAFNESNQDINLIKIIGYMKEEHSYIDIIDNAGGIQEDKMPFIFNEYYTTKKEKSGSGLGLYLSRIILEDRLEGEIKAINLKGGTMFRIIL